MLKETPFDTLRHEIAAEKFAAIRRISDHLAQSLADLEILDGQLREAVTTDVPPAVINKMIDAFNRVREDAIQWRQYLIVTREASGFFSSVLRADAYKIPPRKEPVADRACRINTEHIRGGR